MMVVNKSFYRVFSSIRTTKTKTRRGGGGQKKFSVLK